MAKTKKQQFMEKLNDSFYYISRELDVQEELSDLEFLIGEWHGLVKSAWLMGLIDNEEVLQQYHRLYASSHRNRERFLNDHGQFCLHCFR